MGSDIHMFLEYRKDNSDWEIFSFDQLNLGRNYQMFGHLTNGVVRCQTNIKHSVTPKGLPQDGLSNWLDTILSESIKSGPFHNHSWLSYDEFKTILKEISKKDSDSITIEYQLLEKMMKFLKKSGYQSRLVFWFDS